MENENNQANENRKNQSTTLYDSTLLPLIEKARNGCSNSKIELFESFSHGTNAAANYDLAKAWLDDLGNSDEFMIHIENQILLKEYRIYIEMSFEDRIAMRKQYLNLMLFLNEGKVPLQYWPHYTISMMHQIFMEEGTDVV